VYVSIQAGETFSYGKWLAGLAAGRTLITSGPMLKLAVERHVPGKDVLDIGSSVRSLHVTVDWAWHEPLDIIEIIRDGQVADTFAFAADETRGLWTTTLDAIGGWLAVRAWGRRRTSYGHALRAHTSPVYLRQLAERDRVRAAGQYFLERIDTAADWLAKRARFNAANQRDRMLQLFAEGRSGYEALLAR
jgi:hypothetical protein